MSGERVALRAGTLYGALERLDADGLIAMDREEVVDGRLRRYYRLTDEGTARLAEGGQAAAGKRRHRPPAAGRAPPRPGRGRGVSAAGGFLTPREHRRPSSSGVTAGCCACTRASSAPGAPTR